MAIQTPAGYTVDTTLVTGLSATGTTVAITSNVNWPQGGAGARGAFLASIDEATSSKEIVLVSKQVGGVLTILTRGYANTNAVAHLAGATITVLGFDSDIQSQTFKDVTLTGLLYESATDGIVATAGGGQANAAQISTEVARIITVATKGDSVKLPSASKPGLTIVVINHGANPMQVYGLGTDTVNDNAFATGVSQMQNSEVIYTCTIIGKWYANGLGSGYAGSFPTLSATDQITASATVTQAGGTLVTTVLNRVVTVASAGNALTLPISAVGMQIIVTDAHATNGIVIFPGLGDQINALGVNTSIALAATKTIEFYCHVAGQWHTVLSA